MILRRAGSADLPGLADLEAACFDPSARWSAEGWRAELEGEDRACWVVETTRRGSDDGCQAFAELAAAVCCHVAGDEAELFRVMTAPSARGLGLATMLISAGLAWAEAAGATRMLLEVRHDNATARSLYADLGFTDAYLRTNYYAQGQDAVVMHRPLGEAPAALTPVGPAGPARDEATPGLWADLHTEEGERA